MRYTLTCKINNYKEEYTFCESEEEARKTFIHDHIILKGWAPEIEEITIEKKED